MTRIGETFKGIVSGAVPRGLFVEIAENKCEGFVPKLSQTIIGYSIETDLALKVCVLESTLP